MDVPILPEPCPPFYVVFTHLNYKTLKLHVVKIWYKHTVHGIEIIWLQGNVKLGVFCHLRVFDHYLHGELDHSGKCPPLSNRENTQNGI